VRGAGIHVCLLLEDESFEGDIPLDFVSDRLELLHWHYPGRFGFHLGSEEDLILELGHLFSIGLQPSVDFTLDHHLFE
jgi:hypothetical protein